jgi:sterol desaturase/sphingolipid hydroxylase (fatty acid hydroxylase superfamily)
MRAPYQNPVRIKDCVYLLSSTLIEVLNHHLIQRYTIISPTQDSIHLILFPIMSLYFELIFDFFHYWTHRLCHETLLYRYVHKIHHENPYPTTIQTFTHHPMDLILTNTFPIMATMAACPFSIDMLSWHILLVYKSFVEISGHTSRIMAPSGSFPQWVWIVKMLDIQLYTEDHTLHHNLHTCNYGKRFSMWDKIFGTYRSFQDTDK